MRSILRHMVYGTIDALTFTIPTIAIILSPLNDLTAAVSWAFTYIIFLYGADHILKEAAPKLWDEKNSLWRGNIHYWKTNAVKLANHIPLIWLVAFLPAYMYPPTMQTAPVYLALPTAIGIYIVAYRPLKLEYAEMYDTATKTG
jgi:hypothetical protein